ncbi:MAG TPA: hypothetical protein VGM67_05550 [Gemmatimonadaceae bacterium]
MAAPLGAQIWKSDVPPLTHGWIGVDAGGAIEGAVARTKATGAFRAEVGSLVSPHTVLMVDGLLLLPASSNADCGVDAHGQSTCGVSNDWHLDGLSGSIGRTWGLTGETPRIIASVGAGGYGSQSLTHVHAGVDAAITWAVADWSHLAAVVSVQGILLPNVDGKRIWAIPITVGLRRH